MTNSKLVTWIEWIFSSSFSFQLDYFLFVNKFKSLIKFNQTWIDHYSGSASRIHINNFESRNQFDPRSFKFLMLHHWITWFPILKSVLLINIIFINFQSISPFRLRCVTSSSSRCSIFINNFRSKIHFQISFVNCNRV